MKNITLVYILFFGCLVEVYPQFQHKQQGRIEPLSWHASIQLNDSINLPFTFTQYHDSIVIHNGDESITVTEQSFTGDSVFLKMPVFDSEFRCRQEGNNLTGVYINHARNPTAIFPFQAESGLSYRFTDKPERTNANVNGRYHVYFDGEDDFAKDAVGIFSQDGNRVTGTFLTVTGDYRYLEGEISGNRLSLSAFDGSHMFVFTAIAKGDSLVDGHYYSGKTWHDTWRGMKNENAQLPDPEKWISHNGKDGVFTLSFPDENGKIISLEDKRFQNKPVIIQIMGSWCPNCMDETKFLSKWYNDSNREVEIIALDFERITDTATVRKNITRLKKQFNISYPILFAGSNDKKEAAKTLQLNSIIAFPTLIFINKNRKVITIHSGFSGPAAPKEYEQFKNWFAKTISSLE